MGRRKCKGANRSEAPVQKCKGDEESGERWASGRVEVEEWTGEQGD